MNVYHMIILFLLSNLLMHHHVYSTDTFNIIVKPKWRNLDKNSKNSINFGGQWVLVGSITFKKKSKDPISLETITLRWDGENISNIIASLYKKNISKEFLPIEQNLVCDGIWNKTKQMLIFNFDEKETLAPTTTFYLVLTIPDTIQSIICNGSFVLEKYSLPKPFKNCDQSNTLSLLISNTHNSPHCQENISMRT